MLLPRRVLGSVQPRKPEIAMGHGAGQAEWSRVTSRAPAPSAAPASPHSGGAE